MGFIDKIKSAVNRGGDSLEDEQYEDVSPDEFYSGERRGSAYDNSAMSSGRRMGRNSRSDDFGDDVRVMSRQELRDAPAPEPSMSGQFDQVAPARPGIPYRNTSSGDSVHLVSREEYRANTAEPPRHVSSPAAAPQPVAMGYQAQRRARQTASFGPAPTGEMRIVRASRFEDIEVVSRYYKAGDTVALVLSNVRPEIGRRILDFSFGVVSALGGKVDQPAGSVFVLVHGQGGLTPADRATLRDQGLVE